MNCTTCHKASFVVRTTKTAKVEIRERGCECGDRWETTERETGGTRRRYPAATNSSPVAVPAQSCSKADTPISVSSQVLTLQVSKPLTQTRARVGRIRVDYPEAFEGEWQQTAKTGSKDRALKLWEEFGRPAFGYAWGRWCETDEWRQSWHNFPHVATWLYDGRWKQEPPPAARPRLPDKVEQSREVARAWAAKGTR